MNTKVTVIVDNIPKDTIKGEWGLSILVEHNGSKILADVGGSALFATNLKALGFLIEDIDYATLSHAHYDHANGMPTFFELNSKANFYLQEAALCNCYFKKFFIHKYIGIPKNVFEDYGDRIVKVSGDYSLMDGAWLIPHKTPGLESIGRRENMYQRLPDGSGWRADNFDHEQSLVLETSSGLVIINCCSHGGAVNVVNEVKKTFPDKHIHGLIGGFHLFNKSNTEVRAVGQALLDTGIDYVCTGHCTKDRAYGVLKEVLGSKLEQLHVGLVKEF